jgi:hypothetical protein
VGWKFVSELYILSGCKNVFFGYVFTNGAEVCIDTVLACFCSLLFGKVQL